MNDDVDQRLRRAHHAVTVGEIPATTLARLDALTAQEPPGPAPGELRRQRRRRGTPLVVAASSLLVAGAAIAAVGSGMLEPGEPVKRNPGRPTVGQVATGSAVVLPLRVADPDGGPPWGLATYDITRPAGRDRDAPVRFRCLRVGRVQGGRLGIVGRDGAFGDDGRFHPTPAQASLNRSCSRIVDGQTLQVAGADPSIPASGYTDSPGTAAGGCLKHPILDSAAPATKRRLGGRPLCSPKSQRLVRAGLAGNEARRVTLSNDRLKLTMPAGDGGAYLFVTTPGAAGAQPLRITVTYRDGTRCSEPLHVRGLGHRVPANPECAPPPGF